MPGYCVEHKRYHNVEYGCPDCHSQKRFETIKKLREQNDMLRNGTINFLKQLYSDDNFSDFYQRTSYIRELLGLDREDFKDLVGGHDGQ